MAMPMVRVYFFDKVPQKALTLSKTPFPFGGILSWLTQPYTSESLNYHDVEPLDTRRKNKGRRYDGWTSWENRALNKHAVNDSA